MSKITVSLLLLVLLNACGMTAPAFLATSTGAYSEYKVMSIIKTGTDLLSRITGYECKVSRALKQGIEYICRDVKIHPPENGKINIDKKKE